MLKGSPQLEAVPAQDVKSGAGGRAADMIQRAEAAMAAVPGASTARPETQGEGEIGAP